MHKPGDVLQGSYQLTNVISEDLIRAVYEVVSHLRFSDFLNTLHCRNVFNDNPLEVVCLLINKRHDGTIIPSNVEIMKVKIYSFHNCFLFFSEMCKQSCERRIQLLRLLRSRS